MSGSVPNAPVPILQFFNNAGQPNSGGSVLTQVGGVNYATYSDINLTIPLPNPIPLNSRGEISNASGQSSQCFLASGVIYSFTVYDNNGNVLYIASSVTGDNLALNNTFTGNNTFSGTTTMSGPLDVTGVADFSANNTFSGVNAFTGANTHTGNETHSGAESILSGGSLTVNSGASFSSVSPIAVGAATAAGQALQASQIKAFAVLLEQVPSGSSGATGTVGWNTRELNTVQYDGIGLTLSGNEITLPAGTYYLRAALSTTSTANVTFNAKVALYDVTAGTYLLQGESAYMINTVSANVCVEGVFTVAAGHALALYEWVSAGVANQFGYPSSSGEPEVYANVFIEQMPY